MVVFVIGEWPSKNNNVKVVTHSGSTTEDMLDYIKPKFHTVRNDLINGNNAIKKLRKLVKLVCEIDELKEVKIGFSGLIYRKDKDLEDERNEVNIKLKKFC